MFTAIFYWDYPPLHQSSAELVLRSPKDYSLSNMANKHIVESIANIFSLLFIGVQRKLSIPAF